MKKPATKAFVEVLEAYTTASFLLLEAWQMLEESGELGTDIVPNEKYPFPDSYDEVHSRIVEFRDYIKEHPLTKLD